MSSDPKIKDEHLVAVADDDREAAALAGGLAGLRQGKAKTGNKQARI